MKIRLLTSIAGAGTDVRIGEECECGPGCVLDKATGLRLVESGQAELVRTEQKRTATQLKKRLETATR